MWSTWSTLSECSETCGGLQQRTRNCEYPIQSQPGSPCPGNATQTISCSEKCPGNDTIKIMCCSDKVILSF